MNKIDDLPGFLSPGRFTTESSDALRMALSAFPLYGGAPEDSESSSAQSTDSQSAASGSGDQSGSDTSAQAGGDSAQQLDPQQIADLLKQVQTLSTQNKQLLTENNTFKSQQQETERKQLSREQALEKDLQDALATVEKLDAALKNQAVLNAINSFQDIQFHDPNFVMHELSADIFEGMEVDLENGTVTVSGIENDLRRIAKEKSWAVKKVAQQDPVGGGQQPPKPPRGSGAPPAPPGGDTSKQARRAALIDKYPVINHGRAAIR